MTNCRMPFEVGIQESDTKKNDKQAPKDMENMKATPKDWRVPPDITEVN